MFQNDELKESLIEFFGVEPELQPEDEREFFEAPYFIKRVDELEIHFSYSTNHRDLRVSLFQVGCPDSVLELAVPDVYSVTFKKYRQRQWLRAVSETRGVTAIAIHPTISIRSEAKSS